MSSAVVRSSAPVLADLIPGAKVRDAVLVLGGTGLITVAGQIAIPLPFTPIPLSLATFAVILTGAALGPARAAGSALLYLALGVAGVPLFAHQASGWAFASFGYIIGYVLAAVLVGHLARRRADRTVAATVAMAALGSLVIYAVGLPWLMSYVGVGLGKGLSLGVTPFLIGDLIKAVAAALVLPAAWKIVDRVSGSTDS
ncbi:biotin transporter BioY [Nakamurella silvestris]|nr:biotin transporter BioY [Nakamurella silvestris]